MYIYNVYRVLSDMYCTEPEIVRILININFDGPNVDCQSSLSCFPSTVALKSACFIMQI